MTNSQKASAQRAEKSSPAKRQKLDTITSYTFFTQSDLELDAGVCTDLDDVYGLVDAKRMLKDCVATPVRNPQHYQLEYKTQGSIGKRDVERVLVLYGARGSGKLTLEKSFCLKNTISLVVLTHVGFRPEEDIERAYEFAVENQPCMVVFDELEAAFSPSGFGERNAVLLRTWIDRVAKKKLPIWTLFNCNVVPGPETFSYTLHSIFNHTRWSGDLTIADREKLFIRFINKYMYGNQAAPLSEELIRRYARISSYCVAQDIAKFVSQVFLYRLNQNSDSLSSLSPDSEKLVPSIDDFDRFVVRPGPVGRDRITDFDPEVRNIAPYTNNSSRSGFDENLF
jgi:SpoVK/Ycf46/Vps4 family AAA+-type ATPase